MKNRHFNYAQMSFVPLQHKHLAMTLEWRNKERVRSQFHDSSVLTVDKHLSWFEKYQYDSRQALWVFSKNDVPIGQVSLYNAEGKSVEFGRLIVGNDDMLGNGFGRVATLAALSLAFREEKFWCVSLTVKSANVRALNIYKGIGFQLDTELSNDSTYSMIMYRDDYLEDYPVEP